MITFRGNGFWSWDGRVFKSDVVRSCVRPKVKAIGKLVGKHIRTQAGGVSVNPESYLRFLLEEPNPHMTGQKLLEKMALQLCLNNNAFALIIRDDNGFPLEVYPLPASSVEAIYDRQGNLSLKFYFASGKAYTFPYTDVIHLRQDYNDNDIFGEPLGEMLLPLMNVIATTDQGIVNAIKNSNIVRWLLKFTSPLRPEDLKKQAEEFANNYLSIESKSFGVAAVDTKSEAIQVKPTDYVPNAALLDRVTLRIYALFGTNEKIICSGYTEDEWISYYESEIEPVVIELGGEFTRKIFSRRERGYGNRIVFESAALTTASMKTRLNLVQFVDRGIMTPNEVRAILNYAPLPGGDTPVMRLDMAPRDNTDKAKNTGDAGGGEKESED